MSDFSYCNLSTSFQQSAGSGDDPLASPLMACLDLDQFYVQVARRKDASLHGVPVGISQNHELACVSYEAQACGLYNRCMVSEARAKCPNIRIVPCDMEAIRQASAQFFAFLRQRTGLMVERGSIDETFLELTPLLTSERPSSASSSNATFDAACGRWDSQCDAVDASLRGG